MKIKRLTLFLLALYSTQLMADGCGAELSKSIEGTDQYISIRVFSHHEKCSEAELLMTIHSRSTGFNQDILYEYRTSPSSLFLHSIEWDDNNKAVRQLNDQIKVLANQIKITRLPSWERTQEDNGCYAIPEKAVWDNLVKKNLMALQHDTDVESSNYIVFDPDYKKWIRVMGCSP